MVVRRVYTNHFISCYVSPISRQSCVWITDLFSRRCYGVERECSAVVSNRALMEELGGHVIYISLFRPNAVTNRVLGGRRDGAVCMVPSNTSQFC